MATGIKITVETAGLTEGNFISAKVALSDAIHTVMSKATAGQSGFIVDDFCLEFDRGATPVPDPRQPIRPIAR